MKYFFCLLFINLLITTTSVGQGKNKPVNWSFELKKLGDNKYEFLASAKIDEGWNIYSIHMEEGGPIPTSIIIDKSNDYVQEGELQEFPKAIKKYDDLFEMDVLKLNKEAKYKQTLSLKSKSAKFSGYVTYMCCNADKCLPPIDVPFSMNF